MSKYLPCVFYSSVLANYIAELQVLPIPALNVYVAIIAATTPGRTFGITGLKARMQADVADIVDLGGI